MRSRPERSRAWTRSDRGRGLGHDPDLHLNHNTASATASTTTSATTSALTRMRSLTTTALAGHGLGRSHSVIHGINHNLL